MKNNFHIEQKLPISTKSRKFNVSIQSLKQGINMFNDFFIYKNGLDLKVYDRKCDHANGKLVKKKIKWFALCMNGVLILQKSCITMSILKKPIEHKVNDIEKFFLLLQKDNQAYQI